MSALPHFAEAAHVRQFAYFAGLLKCPLYIQHCTCDETMDEVEKARKEGITVYAQTAPCYLSPRQGRLEAQCSAAQQRDYRKNLDRTKRGKNSLCRHRSRQSWVPRSEMEVKGDVWKSVSGFSSRVEAYLQVMLSLGVNQGRISLERMVECCCENNAKVFGLFPKKARFE